ncbi:MAG: hypothetical protein HY516_00725 [Candidatus Aenigmarchaeota archaeon]|nr:hypothetical protein [Candidatus Aenigmarchaeota archaeon]
MASSFYVDSNEYAKEGLQAVRKGRTGKLKDAEYVIQIAGENYAKALAGLTAPVAGASKQETGAYRNTVKQVEHLRTEIASYTREQANELAKTADKYVSGIRSAVKHEERGRKILGVPYAKRPSAGHVTGKIDEVADYISDAQGRLEAMRQTLEDQRLSGPADENMIKTVKGRLDNAFNDVAALEARHGGITPTTGKVVGFVKGIPGYVKKTPGYVKSAGGHAWGATKRVAGAAGSVGGYVKRAAGHVPHPHIKLPHIGHGGHKKGKKKAVKERKREFGEI